LDHGQHPFDVAQHIVVPEAQHTIATRLQKVSSHGIGGCLSIVSVLSAIKLDHETQIMTCEVSEIRADRRLATKM